MSHVGIFWGNLRVGMPQSQQRISYHPCVRGRVRIRDNLWWHQATNSGDCCQMLATLPLSPLCRHPSSHHICACFPNLFLFILYVQLPKVPLCTAHWPSPSVTKVSASVWQVEVTLQLIQQDQKVNHIDPTKACYWLFAIFAINHQ